MCLSKRRARDRQQREKQRELSPCTHLGLLMKRRPGADALLPSSTTGPSSHPVVGFPSGSYRPPAAHSASQRDTTEPRCPRLEIPRGMARPVLAVVGESRRAPKPEPRIPAVEIVSSAAAAGVLRRARGYIRPLTGERILGDDRGSDPPAYFRAKPRGQKTPRPGRRKGVETRQAPGLVATHERKAALIGHLQHRPCLLENHRAK